MNDEHDFDTPGTLAFWAVLLEDPTTTLAMNRTLPGADVSNPVDFMWEFTIQTPEDLQKYKARCNWINA